MTSETNTSLELLTAVHETGHAILLILIYQMFGGFELVTVSIIPNETTLGRCEARYTSDAQMNNKLHIIYALAGEIAELRLLSNTWHPAPSALLFRANPVGDFIAAYDLLISGEYDGNIYRILWRVGQLIIHYEWDAILNMAKVLVARKSLTGVEFAKLWEIQRNPLDKIANKTQFLQLIRRSIHMPKYSAICPDGIVREFIPFTFEKDQVGHCNWLPTDPAQAAAWQHICYADIAFSERVAPGSVVIDNQRIAGFRDSANNKFIPY